MKSLENFEAENFNAPNTTFQWFEGDGSATYQRYLATEPSLGGTKSMRIDFTKQAGFEYAFFAGEMSPSNPNKNFSEFSRVVIWVNGVADILLKLQDRNGLSKDIATLNANESFGWSRLEFDFSHAHDTIDITDIQYVQIFIEPGDSSGSGTLYFDDIILE